MKKRVLSSVLTFIIVLALVPAGARASSAREPLWLTAPEFRNISAAGGRVETNRALFDAIDRFWAEYYDDFPTEHRHPAFASRGLFPIDIRLSDMFRDTVRQAWREESLAAVMPFNQAFFDEVLSGVEFNFTRSYGGLYMPSTVRSQIVISVDCRDFFTHVALHEIGHALGLGEPLAELFSLELAYSDISEWPWGYPGSLLYEPAFD